jgi:threonine dehydratase
MTGVNVLAHVRAAGIDVVTITDDDIVQAMRLLLERCKLLTEPAGAAALAALLSGAVTVPTGARVGVILSGGNIDIERLKTLLP